MIKKLKHKIKSLQTYKDIKQSNLDNKVVALSESRKSLDIELKNLDNLKQYYKEITLEATTENIFLYHKIKNSLILSVHDKIVKSELDLVTLNLCFTHALSEWRKAYSECNAIESVIASKILEIKVLEDKKESAENDEIGQILFELRKQNG
ncbi:flagellar export protein FliJ [Photobacterium toruni]|uniref:flagellar export protein FliJ n=1 Tax=Photobacterium toruni TaxID=1935446 RepID=UPI0021106FDC|nr:flagellar FliJ family protein [Photobacterium toruni]